MKKLIHNSEDWSTNTDDPEINAFRSIMIDNEQHIGSPYVGIFWYDTENQELFGVRETLAEDAKFTKGSLFDYPVRTCTPLHYQVWTKEYHRGKDKRFKGDYTKIPRGKIFEVEGQGFVVCVGSWINDYPKAKDEIIDRFDLPEDTTFKIDIHKYNPFGCRRRKPTVL